MIYYGDHSITIDGKSTWTDFHLAPKSRPEFAPPKMKTKLVSVEGASSRLDLSTTLTGYPIFENSEGSWEFICDPDYTNWADIYMRVMSWVHGRTRKVILEDDPDYFRECLLTVNSHKSEDHYTSFTINYSAKPYKREHQTIAQLYPEPFAGTVCEAANWKQVVPNIMSYFGEEPVTPILTASANSEIYVRYYNKNLNQLVGFDTDSGIRVYAGTHEHPEIVFGNYGDDNEVIFQCKGVGTLWIDFRRGWL